jgi:hypothetical protein
MPFLRSINLLITCRPPDSTSQPSTPKHIVPLTKLAFLHYTGNIVFLEALVAGLLAPSLWHVEIRFFDVTWPPIVHLPRFINEIEEHFHAVHVVFLRTSFRLSLLQSEYISHFKPRFQLDCVPGMSPSESIFRMSDALSTRLATVEELRVTFDEMRASVRFWVGHTSWLRFYQQFPSVKVLRTEGPNDDYIEHTLLLAHEKPGDDPSFLPALEEIELGKNPLWDSEGQRESRLAGFQPFVSARQQAGRPVKVFFSP